MKKFLSILLALACVLSFCACEKEISIEELMEQADTYYTGTEKIPQDYAKALELYIQAGNRGNIRAMNTVAEMYETGLGTNINNTEAFRWYEKAANKEDSHAIEKVIECYTIGQGTPINEDLANLWHDIAEYGGAEDECTLGVYYYFGNKVPDNCGPYDDYYKSNVIEINYGYAYYWFSKNVDWMGRAMFYIAQCYEDGNGVEQDFKKAAELYEKAANDNGLMNEFAAISIAYFYTNGIGVKQDLDKAAQYLEKSYTKLGIPESDAAEYLYLNGLYYEKGMDITQSYAKAAVCYEAAANKGYEKAMMALGNFYKNGRGVEQDAEKAQEWYQKANNILNQG